MDVRENTDPEKGPPAMRFGKGRTHWAGRNTGMRSVWKGSITFGLVNIPVAVYPATREDKVSFKWMKKKCRRRRL